MLSHMHGFALKARTGLKDAELAAISPIIRVRLSNPFTFLRGEFNLAWDNAPAGEAIQYLAERHTSSLSVLAPTDYPERTLFERLLPPRQEAVEAKLAAALEAEYTALPKSYGDSSPAELVESWRASDAA